MSFLKAFIIELILGSIVAVIFVLTSPCRASIICFIALIPAIVLASYLAFSTSYYWFDFVPTIAGVMVHGYISKKEKGRGKVMEGEGVANFARAFQHAGARSVVVSLWSVASNETVEFMKVFYGYLKAGKGKAEALRLARNEIKAKYPNPYFWSPFILHGEG
ncbi:MAG: CHAT domain-containing protein [Nitrospirae bacterium]|nr:CHAT domain-containing protein [Nitrospirota bacterium]